MKTKWVGPRKIEKDEKTWQERAGRTYRRVDMFLEHFRENRLIEHFLLDESVFMELCSRVQADPDLAKRDCGEGRDFIDGCGCRF